MRRARGVCPFIVIVACYCLPAAGNAVYNGTFDEGLTGWDAIGPAYDGGGYGHLEEDPVFLMSTLQQAFVIPDLSKSLSFRFAMRSALDGTSGGVFPDAFTASLLDPVTFVPLLSTPGFPDFFYIDNTGFVDYDPTVVTYEPLMVPAIYPPPFLPEFAHGVVSLDLSSVLGETPALLAFDVLGSSDGLFTEAGVDDVQVTVVPEPLTALAVPIALAGVLGYLRRRGYKRA